MSFYIECEQKRIKRKWIPWLIKMRGPFNIENESICYSTGIVNIKEERELYVWFCLLFTKLS